jgi:hypothetical protein
MKFFAILNVPRSYRGCSCFVKRGIFLLECKHRFFLGISEVLNQNSGLYKVFLYTILLSIIQTFSACETSHDSSTQEKGPVLTEEAGKMNNKKISQEILTLNTQPATKSSLTSMDENLFGRFFCDRAEFYVIKNPQNNLYSSKTESITLFYLDDQLRQTKYILTNDITTFLINDLGSFKIQAFDVKNKEIVKKEKVIIQTKDGVALNNKLDNYELRWVFSDKEIKYRVNVNATIQFLYTEKTKGFEKEFNQIEKNCV